MKYALLSVSNKTNLETLATAFRQLDITLLATGGTAQYLKQHNIEYTDIADYTGFPEIMGGRVKTLHPKIHGGILARRGTDDETLQQNQINPIDYVVVNLYPFEQTIQKTDCSLDDAIEKIDIGGPTMLRAAAKNYQHVTAIVDPNDYPRVIESLQQQQGTCLALRCELAQKVFALTSHYDSHIAHYLQNESLLPDSALALKYPHKEKLRYGENPHQHAALLYNDTTVCGSNLAQAERIQGKELSYNNLVDADAAYQCVNNLGTDQACCTIIKHATPCGIAQADTLLKAYQLAYAADSQSAFGGIIAFNRSLDADTAKKIIQQQFVEVIIAPEFHRETLDVLQSKPNIRLLKCQPAHQKSIELRSISGGILTQQVDNQPFNHDAFKVVTQRQPDAQEMQDLLFAWHAVRYVKSNAILFVHKGQTLGIGSGQTSRVLSTELAILKAKHADLKLDGAVMASDAFFPFADGLQLAIDAGIKAVIQPGGSKRDAEVIQAADDANIAMVMTHQRCFKH
ncbi:MAG: bifunctional phosphoribosylaminoimidazolecarboxamide formyltransferase/IMP cyclohydrolase [Gammaproteobacteria bacterium]|nr:bifunctional phosphoribosylaminoimidazolecarboxamide formyltransferase/IMP cyclohydrolase [Gammaproteobacteria bacterium]MCH9744786.1 bifunctional phosphoribosylaminoimidazolecarboxamide formyltransferase/IMP cyclohydrolase [Gammaproteobacteria bacterium]